MKSDILGELYKKHYNQALIYALSLCGSRPDAEDIVADAFVKAFLSLEYEHCNFKYWLFAVCRNLWIDRLRKNGRLAGRPFEDYELADGAEDLCEGLIRDERYKRLHEAIMQLNGSYREALTLYYFAGFSIAQLAAILNKTAASAKTTLCRARAKLKHILEVNEYEF